MRLAANPKNMRAHLSTIRTSHIFSIPNGPTRHSPKGAPTARHLSNTMQTRPFSHPQTTSRQCMISPRQSSSPQPRCFPDNSPCSIPQPTSTSLSRAARSDTIRRQRPATAVPAPTTTRSDHSCPSLLPRHIQTPATPRRCSSQSMETHHSTRCKATSSRTRTRWPSRSIITITVSHPTRRCGIASTMV